MKTYTVKYQVATYSGTIEVRADDDADSDQIKAMARAKLSRQSPGGLPMGYQSFKIVSSKDDDE
jgi:hypothetical protein